MKRKIPEWLRSAVFYEVYPQSFYDTNGDGIGDIPGIIEKLDYIQSLGCDAIWLNPCFDSPFRDAGYDVQDFYKVAPRYGTNADLKRLAREAKKRGMRIVLDLVAGHTSIEHPWFQASCSAKPNRYSNRYIWTTDVWTAAGEGLREVNGHADRDGNFIANFFYFQPALNYGFAKPDPKKAWQLPVDHPDIKALHAELRNIMKFWLDQGMSGFRVDMAPSLIKNDPGQAANIAFWREIRIWLESNHPEAALISEWSFPSRAISAGFHVDFLIHFGWDGKVPLYTGLFRHHLKEFGVAEGPSVFQRDWKGNARQFLEDFTRDYTLTRGQGYTSLPTGNHDVARIRKTRDVEDLKVIYAFLFTMPGVPFIYYGDEIGMRHIDGLTSKEGGYSRTGARTPMQWDSTRNAGFSSARADTLYLPIDPASDRPTVRTQEKDPDSLLNFVRKLIALRRKHQALGSDGEFLALFGQQDRSPFAYLRRLGRECFVIALNPSDKPATIRVSRKEAKTLTEQVSGPGFNIRSGTTHITLTLPPVSHAIFKAV